MTKKLKITVLGTVYEVLVEEVTENKEEPVSVYTAPKEMPAPPPLYAKPKQITEVKAPLSGTVSEISVVVGDMVRGGDVLCAVEAMKMQNSIPSPVDGTVTQIAIRVGDSVDNGDLLITIE